MWLQHSSLTLTFLVNTRRLLSLSSSLHRTTAQTNLRGGIYSQGSSKTPCRRFSSILKSDKGHWDPRITQKKAQGPRFYPPREYVEVERTPHSQQHHDPEEIFLENQIRSSPEYKNAHPFSLQEFPKTVHGVQLTLPKFLRDRWTIYSPSNAYQLNGQYVLYWMQGCFRIDQNPSLQVAAYIAKQYRVPLTLICALAINDAPQWFPTARRIKFILQGIVDVHDQLQKLGANVDWQIRLDEKGQAISDVARQARDAVAVVTDAIPLPPHPYWTNNLQIRLNNLTQNRVPVISVDSTSIGSQFVFPETIKYFKYYGACKSKPNFRENIFNGVLDQNINMIDQNITFPILKTRPSYSPQISSLSSSLSPSSSSSSSLAPSTNLISQDRDWKSALKTLQSVDTVMAQLTGIDHSVAPAELFVGGSSQAYRRLLSFQKNKHNVVKFGDPKTYYLSPNGTTLRLNAHLHFGMISPFKVVTAISNKCQGIGIDLMVNDFMLKRTLKYAAMAQDFHHGRDVDDPFAYLPFWARANLDQHIHDLRKLRSEHQLRMGQSGDPFWDAIHFALRRYGEMSEYLRYYWARHILLWIRTPQDALKFATHLYYKYSLEGANPQSTCDLMYTFGRFDRPMEAQTTPVTGVLRALPDNIDAGRHRYQDLVYNTYPQLELDSNQEIDHTRLL